MPAGLVTDLDGTLSPIVADPAAARAAPGAAAALEALASRLAVAAVVSGRSAADARRILGTASLLIVGNHGLEWLAPGSEAAELPAGSEAFAAAVERALGAVPRLDGVAIERKGLSATIHVRAAADPGGATEAIDAALAGALPAGIELRRGRMSIEVRPTDAGDKGSAVRRVVERHALRGLVVLGDDVTDLDMFRAAAGLRAAGRLRAAILAVRGGREVPANVELEADAVLDSPDSAVRLLEALAGRPARRRSSSP